MDKRKKVTSGLKPAPTVNGSPAIVFLDVGKLPDWLGDI